ncbi:MAG TPA: hypothetical protein VKC65_02805 [Gaiellaceae bacterium]|nr:hypothetical protein [Gaiellaceae bacterium]
MGSQTAAFVVHLAVGFAALIIAFSSSLEGFRPLFLFVAGIPWLAGFVAFYGLPRTAYVWLFPVVTLLLGLVLWWLAVALSGLGS